MIKKLKRQVRLGKYKRNKKLRISNKNQSRPLNVITPQSNYTNRVMEVDEFDQNKADSQQVM